MTFNFHASVLDVVVIVAFYYLVAPLFRIMGTEIAHHLHVRSVRRWLRRKAHRESV
jgi:hypothetical protein